MAYPWDKNAIDQPRVTTCRVRRSRMQLFPEPPHATVFHDRHANQRQSKVRTERDIIAYDFRHHGPQSTNTSRRVYARSLFGFIRKDYKRVAEVQLRSGYVPADNDVDEFLPPCPARRGGAYFSVNGRDPLFEWSRPADLSVRVTELLLGWKTPDRADLAATHHGLRRRVARCSTPYHKSGKCRTRS